MTSVQVNDNCAAPSVKSKPTSAALILYVPKGEERDRIKAVLSQWPGPASDQDRAPVFFRDPETGKCEEIVSITVSARAATTASAVAKLGCRSEYGASAKWGMFGPKIVSGLSSFVPAPVPAPAPAPAPAAPVSAVKPLIGVKAPLTEVPVAVTTTEAVVKSFVRAQVLAVSNGEEGRFTISTVDERGQRSDIAIRPTRKANEAGERYHFVAKALSEFFSVALAVELDMDQALDPGQFTMDPSAKIGGTDLPEGEVYPGGADLPTRKAWLTARKDDFGKWCVDELIRAQFRNVRPVALTVDRYDVWPVYTWAVPAPIEVAAVGQAPAEAVALLLARPVSETADGRHVIALSPNIADMGDWCVQYLSESPTLYQRTGALCEVLEGGDEPTLRPVPAAHLDRLIASKIKFTRKTEAGKEKEEVVPARVRDSVAAMGSWPLIRPILGLTTTPIFRADGTICTTRGYDRSSKMFLTADSAPISDAPTAEDAGRAARKLWDLVAEFPWKDPAHGFGVWLAGLLTLCARPAIGGPTPVFAISANDRGCGKGLLSQAMVLIATGRLPAAQGYTGRDEEDEKRITASLSTGPQSMWLDNVDPAIAFGGGSWERLVTCSEWQGRTLGKSEVPKYPNRTVVILNGNGLHYTHDMARRVLTAHLFTAKTRSLESRKYTIPDLIAHLREHRAEYVAAAFTILRAFVVAGRPAVNLRAMDAFEGWGALVRGALLWVRDQAGCEGLIMDPYQPEREAESEGAQDHAALIALWAGATVATRGARADVGVSVAAALRDDLDGAHRALREFLAEHVDLLTPAKVGAFLRKFSGKPCAMGKVSAALVPVKRSDTNRTWAVKITDGAGKTSWAGAEQVAAWCGPGPAQRETPTGMVLTSVPAADATGPF